ncbi:hypothetical protein WA026_009306 [Henosepilachna vigintioctopunctata]|uniref:Protein kinase domain-containing protein n=1 Tax=Henosepilachna vigintioctopunctata TaxID=420089 RepID=A0AAW1UW67_9CUCU
MDMSMYDLLKNRSRRIPEIRVKVFLYQILKGLTHLHNHGLFHRDVKPENILIKMTNLGELIKLADLGSVRGIYSEPPYTEYISTRWYRSPECLLTVGNYGPKMDVWATGCVFYEMLTLKPLFPGSNELDQLHKIHGILGTPSGKLLEKLKNKNCTCFPETTGTGIYPLMTNFSEHAKRLLRLMLEYDPDKRINARRLLQSVYFDSIRFGEESSEHLSYLSRVKLDQNSRGSSDTRKTLAVQSSAQEKCGQRTTSCSKGIKREPSKARESNSSKKTSLSASKTLVNMIPPGENKKTNMSKKTESKSPKVLNAITSSSPSLDKSKKHVNDNFRKTTSNLMYFTQPLITSKEIADSKHFQSKSFVQSQKKTPRKVSEMDEKLTTILETAKRVS